MIQAADLIQKCRYALDNKWGYIWGGHGQIWTQAAQDAATREQTKLYGQQWVGKHVVDCSGLFSWAFKELGGYMYHGSNTMWNKYCTSQGKITAGMGLKPGTAVFTGSDSNKGHVGLYAGDGIVIEAAGTKAGVITSKVTASKWKYWGELKGMTYGDDPDPAAKPTLRRGDSGSYVTLAQTELIQRGYDLGKWGADGKFGAQTEKAVKQFQKDNGLIADGVIGKKTWDALLNASPVLYTVSIPHLSKSKADELVNEYPGASAIEERWN